MLGFRSVLWIGPGEELGGDLVADAPTLEFCWSRDVRDAEEQPLESFDAIVLSASGVDAARLALRRLLALRRTVLPPVLVRVNGADGRAQETLAADGAADVLAPSGGASGLLASLEDVLVSRRGHAAHDGRRGALREPPAESLALSRSPTMRATLALVERAARSRASVLLCGETGTGKEVLARTLHARSERNGRAFVAVNCAAFPETLLESELFGHVRGSFTGAWS